jgi:hypothetical protein
LVADRETHGLVRAFSTLSSLTTLPDSESEEKKKNVKTREVVAGIDDGLVAAPVPPKTPRNAKSKSTATPARTTSKKALARAEQAERATYARSLFDELNRTVFGGGLPVETTLVWSNRLLTTAGRARWHRSVSLPISQTVSIGPVGGSFILFPRKIQGRRGDDFDRARDQDLGLQRQVEVTTLWKRGTRPEFEQ